MDKTIYMPDDLQVSQMMLNAWATFKRESEEHGFSLGEGAQELFVAGYCFGNNDCLSVIRDQLSLDGYRIETAEVPNGGDGGCVGGSADARASHVGAEDEEGGDE